MKLYFQKKSVKIASALLALFLLLLLAFGAFHYSKTNRINAYVAAKSSSSGAVFEQIKEYMVWADTNEQITNDEARYTRFSRLKSSDVAAEKERLKKAGPEDELYVKSVGRKFLIFPDYRIAVKPIRLTLKTNLPNLDLLLNDKKVAVSDSENFTTTLERLPAADYRASVYGYHENHKIKVSKTYDGQNELLDLSLLFKTFTVVSNVKDGELYFDDNRVGTLSDGQFQVEDYPVTETAQAMIKKRFPDGQLKSSKHPLAPIENGSQLEITVDNLLGDDKAGQLLVAAFDQLLAYLNAGQDSAQFATLFEEGANNDFYKGLKESVQAKFQTDIRKASSLSTPSILLTKVTQVGKKSYLIDFSATYDFLYNKETDPAKSTSGNVRQELVGKMPVKKVGQNYLVSQKGAKSITVASEDNQVKAPSLFPEALLGTWLGQKSDMSISMTLSEDGTVTTKIDYKNPNTPGLSKSVKVKKVEEKGEGIYLYRLDQGTDTSVLTPGGGLGGMNVKYAFGFQVAGQTAHPIVWQTGLNSDFDYSKPLPGIELKKQ
ncbi:zinc ribbon domain-containing protein [Streptococcus ictaluri]|uniref:TcaA 4th domain-containing protein n=1 Tax=Streptococcus ictaluri 707-05 TaxID=764299 RepID=G5JZD9_9STRE|nr:hypothetical protein [Streptococcus ictaluri]EHI70869.1 hypothetical protein STRIC_0649 [Streptococcus ictaluri 707-05]